MSAAGLLLPDEAPASGEVAVGLLEDALSSLWQAIGTLADADTQSGGSTYAEVIEDLTNDSALLVTVSGYETELAISYWVPIFGADPATLAATQAHLDSANAAFSQGDHLAAVAQYLQAIATNQARVIEINPLGTLSEGTALSGAGSFTDPDSISWTSAVDYGDGSGIQPLALADDKTFAHRRRARTKLRMNRRGR